MAIHAHNLGKLGQVRHIVRCHKGKRDGGIAPGGSPQLGSRIHDLRRVETPLPMNTGAFLHRR